MLKYYLKTFKHFEHLSEPACRCTFGTMPLRQASAIKHSLLLYFQYTTLKAGAIPNMALIRTFNPKLLQGKCCMADPELNPTCCVNSARTLGAVTVKILISILFERTFIVKTLVNDFE